MKKVNNSQTTRRSEEEELPKNGGFWKGKVNKW